MCMPGTANYIHLNPLGLAIRAPILNAHPGMVELAWQDLVLRHKDNVASGVLAITVIKLCDS